MNRLTPITAAASVPAGCIPPYMIATVRNNQLPTTELAKRLGVTDQEIDAIRALGPTTQEKP